MEYIWTMQFRTDKEEFISTYHKVLSQSMSSSFVWWQSWEKYDSLKLEFWSWDSNMIMYALTWWWQKEIYANKLPYSKFSWFKLNNSYYGTWNLIFSVYNIWCKSMLDSIEYTTWTLYFDIVANNVNNKYCFSVELLSCKLKEYLCE